MEGWYFFCNVCGRKVDGKGVGLVFIGTVVYRGRGVFFFWFTVCGLESLAEGSLVGVSVGAVG